MELSRLYLRMQPAQDVNAGTVHLYLEMRVLSSPAVTPPFLRIVFGGAHLVPEVTNVLFAL